MRTITVIGLAFSAGWLGACAGGAKEPGMAGSLDPLKGAPSLTEWRASTYNGGRQDQAAIDAGADGTVYTVWASDKPRWGIYGQRFDSRGKALGGETALSLWQPGMQGAPTVAAIPGGGAWVAWQSWQQDGDGGAIIARRFGKDFAGTSEVLVNQDPDGDQRSPVVAVSPGGVAAFVWTVNMGEGPTMLRARLFDASGAPLTDEMGIGDREAGSTLTPSIAAAPDGTFAIAYALFDRSMNPEAIRVQRLDAAGRRIGGPMTVSGSPGVEPCIGAAAGGLVVAWIDTVSDGDEYGVVARRLDGQARPLGEPWVVNQTTAGTQSGAAVAALGDGFAIAWNGPDGVYARPFEADGQAAGAEVNVGHGERAMRLACGTRRLVSVGSRLMCAWSGQAPESEEEREEHEREGAGDPDAGGAVGMSMLAYDGFDGRGVTQGVREGMRPARRGAQGAAEPHRPPTFDPKKIGTGRRQILNDGEGGFDAVLNTGWTPPDPHMAVGPEHIICMTNGAIRFFLKNGTQTFADEIEGNFGFWGGLGATGFVFDPEVVYDANSGRFFAMAAEWQDGIASHCLVGVSDNSDPNGTWFKYRFDTTDLAGDFFDSPNIGVTDDALIICGDGFGKGANYPVYIFDKASILAGNPPAIKKSLLMQTTTQSAGFPPVSYDSPPAVYYIEHKELGNNSQVRLAALTDSLTNPAFTFFNLTVPSYTSPPEDPPQKGTAAHPEAFDVRFWNVAYRNGSLWATHHVGSTRVLARWYEINMNGWPKSGKNPELVQSGNIDAGPTVRTSFSAITADDAGAAAMVFARSAPDEYFSMSTAYRLPCDPLGTFRAPESQKAATGPYNPNRWGDYGSVEPDPVVPGKFWAIHEYAIGESWRCWIAPFTAMACPADVNCDGVLDLFDFLQFTNLFNAHDGRADCDGNGTFDLFDFLCFVNLFNGGC